MTDLITLPRATVQQMLEALEAGAESWRLIGPAIEALRAALEQPEQAEPVAFAYYWPPTNTLRRNPAYQLEWGPTTVWKAEVPLYTHPPRREWRGLTDDENNELSITMVKGHKSVNWLASAIEKALKERNHE